jgi:cytochrome c553
MGRLAGRALFLVSAAVSTIALAEDQPLPPAWAYPGAIPRGPQSEIADLTIPGSAVVVSAARLNRNSETVDWFPGAHPPAPQVVRMVTPPRMACGFCHQLDGAGRPENAALAGLPREYFIRQVSDIHSGRRQFPAFGPSITMRQPAMDASTTEVEEAADYFSKLPYVSHVRVVEAADIPKPTMERYLWRFSEDGQRAQLGARLIEGPEKFSDFEMRDPRAVYVAYVPPGAVQRGAALAAGDAVRPACASCHGEGLRGGAVAPPLAGRWPTVAFRQLWSFKAGLRNGPGAALMKPAVGHLSELDMIALAAYAGTLKP